MELNLTIRHIVTLMIMCKGMPEPSYILEKIQDLGRTNVPEQFLDDINLQQFRHYAERFKMDWNSMRDYHEMPADRQCFDPHTGEALKAFIPIKEEGGRDWESDQDLEGEG